MWTGLSHHWNLIKIKLTNQKEHNNFVSLGRNLQYTVGISETWLNDVNQNYTNITGYCFISSNRVHKCVGGAGLICMTLLLLTSFLIWVFLTLHYLIQSLWNS